MQLKKHLQKSAKKSGSCLLQGVAFSDDAAWDGERAAFESMAQSLLQRVAECLPLDGAADQLAARFLQQRLPPACQPVLDPPERNASWGSRVLLRGAGLARLAIEGDMAVVYHCLANERQAHASGEADAEHGETAAGRMEFELDLAPALEALLLRVPVDGKGIVLRKVISNRQPEHLTLVKQLYDAGIIVLA